MADVESLLASSVSRTMTEVPQRVVTEFVRRIRADREVPESVGVLFSEESWPDNDQLIETIRSACSSARNDAPPNSEHSG